MRAMEDRLKILPAVVLCAGLMFVLKALDVWTGLSSGAVGISSVSAASGGHEAPAHADDHAPPETKPEAAGHGEPAPAAPPAEAPAATATAGETGDAKAAAALEAHGFEVEPSAPLPDYGAPRRGRAGSLDDGLMSKSEVDVLESLAARRAELDKRGADLDMRAALLAATEKRVNERVEELKALEAQIAELLRQKKEIDQQKIASLVKIYEAMKPKDAARIFEQLDGDVLLGVAAGMKEAKLADVMAQMSPETAKTLTVRLADRSSRSSEGGT